jgi:hypothetical protein
MECLANTPFWSWIPTDRLRPDAATLEQLSGYSRTAPASLRSNVAVAVERAWSLPIARLSCEQVRMLTSQKCGLRWIALTIAIFVHLHPKAEITFYPGDLTMMALEAFGEIAAASPEGAALIRDADYSWMAEEYDFSAELIDNARLLVETIGARPF